METMHEGDEMTPEQQRIAIAEACGWKLHSELDNTWCAPHQTDCPLAAELIPLPDYPNDLNAMHEAEKTLTYAQGGQMTVWIERMNCAGYGPQLFATAPQRARAFLETLGLWDNDESMKP